MTELIFISLESWDEVWRRNQFLCAELMSRQPELRILFVQPAKDISHALRSGKLRALGAPRHAVVAGKPRVTLTRALKLLPNSWHWGRRCNEWLARRHVRRAMQRLGLRRPVLWLNDHAAFHLVGRLSETAVIYDVTDDWTATRQQPALRALTIEQDRRLCGSADAVIVCSSHLWEMKRVMTQHLHLVPNGVDAAHYAQVLDRDALAHAETRHWARPVLGYTGTVQAERVDLDLLVALANAFPRGTVALVGPVHLTAEERARLRACANIIVTGAVPYEELPSFMRAFDVCLTPHLVTPFTESLNPIKLWEYLAAGKPIVSTAVAGFRDYPKLVRVARDTQDFLHACRCALEEAQRPAEVEQADARRTEAREHSWERRAEAIEQITAEAVSRRAMCCHTAAEEALC